MTQLVLIVTLPILIAVLLILNLLLAPNTGFSDAEKLSPYECGIQTLSGQTRAPFSISFWLVAVLFLLFDIDLALLYPLSLTLTTVGNYAYWTGIIFLGLLTAGFAYEWGKGAIKFTSESQK